MKSRLRSIRDIERRWYDRLLVWSYPDLRRVSPDDRFRVLMVTAHAPQPSPVYKALGCAAIAFVVIVPLVVFFGWEFLAGPPRSLLEMMLRILASAAAFIAPLAIVFYINSLFDRARLRRVLRDINIAICHHCGYDLTGHTGDIKQCPECGRVS